MRAWLCVLLYGGHELYLAWTLTRVFQKCVRCGYETRGWDVTPALRFRSTWMRKETHHAAH
jgi:hypothetical protein